MATVFRQIISSCRTGCVLCRENKSEDKIEKEEKFKEFLRFGSSFQIMKEMVRNRTMNDMDNFWTQYLIFSSRKGLKVLCQNHLVEPLLPDGHVNSQNLLHLPRQRFFYVFLQPSDDEGPKKLNKKIIRYYARPTLQPLIF